MRFTPQIRVARGTLHPGLTTFGITHGKHPKFKLQFYFYLLYLIYSILNGEVGSLTTQFAHSETQISEAQASGGVDSVLTAVIQSSSGSLPQAPSCPPPSRQRRHLGFLPHKLAVPCVLPVLLRLFCLLSYHFANITTTSLA